MNSSETSLYFLFSFIINHEHV